MKYLTVPAFVATVYAANWLVEHYGPVKVWPTDLLAPAGVYVVAVAFVLRDFIQYRIGRGVALTAIGAGCALSVLVSPTLAFASAAAFTVSEVSGLGVFWALQGHSLAAAIATAGVAAAALDSAVFLWLAFHSLAFFEGQFIAKLGLSLLAAPVVIGVRLWTARPST